MKLEQSDNIYCDEFHPKIVMAYMYTDDLF